MPFILQRQKRFSSKNELSTVGNSSKGSLCHRKCPLNSYSVLYPGTDCSKHITEISKTKNLIRGLKPERHLKLLLIIIQHLWPAAFCSKKSTCAIFVVRSGVQKMKHNINEIIRFIKK